MVAPYVRGLEIELERQLDPSMAVLVNDLAEGIDIVLRILRFRGKVEALGRIANRSGRLCRAVVDPGRGRLITYGLQRQVDVTQIRIRVCLVEYVEEPGSELDLLVLADCEVLEESDIEVMPRWTPHIERRLVSPGLSETGNRNRVQVEVALPDPRITRHRVLQEYGCDSSRLSLACEVHVGAEIRKDGSRTCNVAREPDRNRSPALERCDARHLPAVSHASHEPIVKDATGDIGYLPVV